jgi:hypothetical protein
MRLKRISEILLITSLAIGSMFTQSVASVVNAKDPKVDYESEDNGDAVFANELQNDTKMIATITNNENGYYNTYDSDYFSYTFKKNGWL